MNDEPIRGGWHVDKRVSVGHIITTLTVALSIVMWMMSLEKRVDLNALAIAYNAQAIEQRNRDLKDQLTALTVMVQRVDDRLERLSTTR